MVRTVVLRWVVCLAMLACSWNGIAQSSKASPKFPVAPGADLFASTNIIAFRLDLATAAMESLRTQPREWAKADLRAGNVLYRNVAVHIKGSQGSLQPIDARPALTVSFTKFDPERKFHGLGKIHFNNEAEDPSFMTEILCSEVCRNAGLPAARSTYATLTINGRPLGLYLLKEGLTKDFLGQYFSKTSGNLYDGGFRKDINEPLERIGGKGAEDQSDRRALLAAAREPDLKRRWERLNAVLDTDRFITLLALSAITWNWDGYPMSRNNYRIYHDPTTDKMVFIPHGLDQMFWEPKGSIYPPWRGLVAASVMTTSEGRQRYRDELASLQTNVFHVTRLQRRIDELAQRLRPFRGDAAQQAARLKQRIAARWASIDQQLALSTDVALEFSTESVPLRKWIKVAGVEGAILEEVRSEEAAVLRIEHTQPASSSWAAGVLLPRGTYEFAGRYQIRRGAKNNSSGRTTAGLQATGSIEVEREPVGRLGQWTEARTTFVVKGRQEMVQLRCFLHQDGEVWYDLNSLSLKKIARGAQ